MTKAIRVIVVASMTTESHVIKTLHTTKFKQGDDWWVVRSCKLAEEYIVRGQPQLLMVDGRLASTAFVMKMRRDNPALKAGSMSGYPDRYPGIYAYNLQRSGEFDFTGLVEVVAQYISLVTPQQKKA